jgi:hypothetical protein
MDTLTFLALNLAFGQHIDEESRIQGSSIMARLVPVNSTGRLLERGLQQSTFGQLFAELWKRGAFHTPPEHEKREKVMRAENAGPAVFQTNIVTPPIIVGLPDAGSSVSAFQNLPIAFGDIDPIMDDSMWATGHTGAEYPYCSWV